VFGLLHDEGPFTVAVISRAIQDLLITLEMVGFGLFHQKAFNHADFISNDKDKLSTWEAYKEALDASDIMIPSIALAQHYLEHRVVISDNKYEGIKSYTHRMRIANFDTMSASNRQNDIPRTRNGRDKVLDARYDANSLRHLIYWRKGVFAIGRKCICGESFTLSHAERCFGTHMKIEGLIAEDEYSNVKYYIDAMWSTSNNS